MKNNKNPYTEQEAAARAALAAARARRDETRQRARAFEIEWSAHTDLRTEAQQKLTSATSKTPLADIVEWQTTIAATQFLDLKFRAEYEALLETASTAEAGLKRARDSHEVVLAQVGIYRNDQATKQSQRIESQLDAELRNDRAKRRAELLNQAAV